MRQWAIAVLSATAAVTASAQGGDWIAYGRTGLATRHSPLRQITPANVGALAVAWRYHTGEPPLRVKDGRPPRTAATPLAIGGRLFLSTAMGRIIALDGATGRELWRFDAKVDPAGGFGDFVSRGVAWWRDPAARTGTPCAERIVAGIVDARLIALDAVDGRPCAAFGQSGEVSLRKGLRNPPADLSEYELTSPPAIVDGVIVVGSAVADNGRTEAASGEVRGYDVRSGRLLWTWDPVPQDRADPAYATWEGPDAHRAGGANAWSVIAADPERHMVVVPTASPSVDYWGGSRLGSNAHANSVVALDSRTGRMRWSFQTVHHDLWDYDNAAPPALVEVTIGGRRRAAVAQATKTGQLFLLDRDTGKPLLPVTERAVPASDAEGEQAYPTQPFGIELSPTRLSADELRAGIADPVHRDRCLAALSKLRNEGAFTPPSPRGTLMMPSNIGGVHWGGLTYDPAAQLAIIPTNRVAAVVTLLPRASAEAARAADGAAGERLGLEYAPMRGSPYVLRRELFTAGGRPCTPQPYGALQAVHLGSGRIAWTVPLGTGEGLPFGPARGMVNLGGPISTASGLVFIGASPDAYLRAFETRSGRELWRGKLPAGARATPMTYADRFGRQYVAISATGDGEAFGSADEIVAFALPAGDTKSLPRRKQGR